MFVAEEELLKTPAEERIFTFDFKPDANDPDRGLATGEVIQASPAPTIVDTPADLTIDNILISGGTKVQARYRNGTHTAPDGTKYHVLCTATTLLDGQTQVRQFCGYLRVKDC